MSLSNWSQRFFTSTRGRIIELLRRHNRTVDELAQELDLTDNAVRVHLANLERDGMVMQHGERRGSGKPAYIYDLTPNAEQLFPKAYGLVLRQLLDVLAEEMTPEEQEQLLRRVGRRLAVLKTVPAGDERTRLEAAVATLNELGGMAELEEHDGAYTIVGYSCPLAEVLPDHPQVCKLAETLLTELVGEPVHQHCKYNSKARCCFDVERG